MGWTSFLDLFWRRPGSAGWPDEPSLPRHRLPPRPLRRHPVHLGDRVRLQIPIASAHAVHIQAGVVGTVVGGDARAKTACVELDLPRTRITVPWGWLEDEPEPSPETPG